MPENPMVDRVREALYAECPTTTDVEVWRDAVNTVLDYLEQVGYWYDYARLPPVGDAKHSR